MAAKIRALTTNKGHDGKGQIPMIPLDPMSLYYFWRFRQAHRTSHYLSESIELRPLAGQSHIDSYNDVRQEYNAPLCSIVPDRHNLERQPLQKASEPDQFPKSYSHLQILQCLNLDNENAMQREQWDCLGTQYQSGLALLQNRSVLESLLMKIATGKDYALHCLSVLVCLNLYPLLRHLSVNVLNGI